MTPLQKDVLGYLDSVDYSVNLTTLIRALEHIHPADDVKGAAYDLHEIGRVNKVYTLGMNGRTYPLFYSLFIKTTKGCGGTPEPMMDERRIVPRAPDLVDPVPNDKSADVSALSEAMRSALIERLEKDLAPEPTVERRAPDRRRLSVMDVIDRWRLPFRLSRVIEIVGGARNRKLTQEDAEVVVRLIRQHVREWDQAA